METLIESIQNIMATTFAGMSVLATVLLCGLCIAIVLLVIYFFRIHIAYRMAVNRHRDPLGWALLSFFVSPILTWLILLLAGDQRN